MLLLALVVGVQVVLPPAASLLETHPHQNIHAKGYHQGAGGHSSHSHRHQHPHPASGLTDTETQEEREYQEAANRNRAAAQAAASSAFQDLRAATAGMSEDYADFGGFEKKHAVLKA